MRAGALPAVLAVVLLLAAGRAGAEPPAAGRWQAEAGAGAESASGGGADRRQIDLALRRHFADRRVLEASVRQTRQGGVNDEELGAAFAFALDDAWSLAGGATHSPSHRVLARFGGRLELARRFADGWVGSLGASRRLHDGGGNSGVSVGVERYVDVWRVAAAVSRVRLDGGASEGGLRLQLDRYFADERGRWGVIVARGRELEGLPATPTSAADVLDQRVTTLALLATWPLAAGWAVSADLAHVRNDDLRRRSGFPAAADYRRNGLRVGVRHDF